MERSLKEQLLLLKSVVENAPLPLGVYAGSELTIVLANDAMIKALGKGNEILGKRYTEILPELEGQELFAQARSAMATGIPFHAKGSRVDIEIDGLLKTHYYDYSYIPLRDTEGNIFAIMNTGADVTELVNARYNIEHAEEKLRLAVSAGGLGTYITDLSNNQVVVSGLFNEIWGTTGQPARADIIGRICPEDLAIREEAHARALLSGDVDYEVRLEKGLSLRWVRVKGRIIRDDAGNPASLLGVVQDITETREFAEELKRQVEQRTSELRRSNEDLLHFANIVSHDLKEPLRKISTFNSLLWQKLGEDINEDARKYFGKVEDAANRMTSIIDGVLNYATLNELGHPVEKININQLIEDIKGDLELVIQEKKAILILDKLPEIEGAPVLLHQLFYNLIHNALKFSRPHDPPRVAISYELAIIDDTEYMRICIKDNGIGFDPAHSQKIFDVFKRLHSKDEFEGTGLGLALCKRIAERHQGDITAVGSKIDGAKFTVELPLRLPKRYI
ncbi:sensor histidine kinase [Sphingobacterium siyangense]|uniref:sensor histidine kinase n=1 Tax=Sphingobacterium siyangense TaxID=459529 RepID=UPI0019662FED|nr:ATP-binding protein [Sphingobacterium siyangense]QRY55488.1 PAS domain-containing protein [Sphingobacterium siyangense]